MTELAENTELHRSRDRWRSAAWFWFCAFVFSLIFHGLARPACASAQSPETWAAAKADQANFPPADWGYYYYLSTDHLEDAKQVTAGRTAAFTVASFSPAVVLEQHVPVQVARGLYRIDLRGLQWAWRDWHQVLSRYPYAPGKKPAPLVVRADWLVVELADGFESDSGARLLYGGKNIPANLKQFQDFWKVTKGDPKLSLLHVEQESGVSLLDIRWVANSDTADRGSYWQTQDNASRNFNAKTDPLETLLNQQRTHDASEHIVLFPKLSVTQGAGGVAMQTLLANGKGVVQGRAPVDIVSDHTNLRGLAEIRNWSSCVSCHEKGIVDLGKNNLRELVAAGVELFADKKSQELIEQQYLADVRMRVEISRAQDDYATFVALCTGWGPTENTRAFRELLDDYDRPLNLEDAAREFAMTPKELSLALGYASTRQIKLGARLASLPHGGTLPRDYFESQYETAFFAVELWKRATSK